MTSSKVHRRKVGYRRIAAMALSQLPRLVQGWLRDGQRIGAEWVARNPTRNDSTLGSFKINLHTGRWADFATGDKGGDAISLLAYLRGISQSEAAVMLARELGMQS